MAVLGSVFKPLAETRKLVTQVPRKVTHITEQQIERKPHNNETKGTNVLDVELKQQID